MKHENDYGHLKLPWYKTLKGWAYFSTIIFGIPTFVGILLCCNDFMVKANTIVSVVNKLPEYEHRQDAHNSAVEDWIRTNSAVYVSRDEFQAEIQSRMEADKWLAGGIITNRQTLNSLDWKLDELKQKITAKGKRDWPD